MLDHRARNSLADAAQRAPTLSAPESRRPLRSGWQSRSGAWDPSVNVPAHPARALVARRMPRVRAIRARPSWRSLSPEIVLLAMRPKHRQVHRERRALPEHALDRQAAAVPAGDVLDQGETEAGAALCPALAHVDAIEALGQPRQVVRGDAGAIVAHRDTSLAAPFGERERDVDALAGGRVFERVLDQVLEQADELVAVAAHRHAFGRHAEPHLHLAVAGKRLQPVHD